MPFSPKRLQAASRQQMVVVGPSRMNTMLEEFNNLCWVWAAHRLSAGLQNQLAVYRLYSGLYLAVPSSSPACCVLAWDLLLFPRFRQFSDPTATGGGSICSSDFYSTICVQIAALFQSALWLRWNLNWYFIHLLDNWKWPNQAGGSRSQV